MLQFNPLLRTSAKYLLKNPIFDSLRQKKNESMAPFKIKIKIDIMKEFADTYDNDYK
jgi:hypothetical protein